MHKANQLSAKPRLFVARSQGSSFLCNQTLITHSPFLTQTCMHACMYVCIHITLARMYTVYVTCREGSSSVGKYKNC